jgi:hypothetical protein
VTFGCQYKAGQCAFGLKKKIEGDDSEKFWLLQIALTCNTNLPEQTAGGCIGHTIRIYIETEKAIFYFPRILCRGQASVYFLFYIIGLVFSTAEASQLVSACLAKIHHWKSESGSEIHHGSDPPWIYQGTVRQNSKLRSTNRLFWYEWSILPLGHAMYSLLNLSHLLFSCCLDNIILVD